MFTDHLGSAPQGLSTHILTSHFGAAIANRELYSKSLLKKLDCATDFDLQVALAGIGSKANLFGRAVGRALGALPFQARLLVLVTSEVQQLANWWMRVRRDFNEIETGFLGHQQGVFCLDNPDLLTVFTDKADRADPNHVIAPRTTVHGHHWGPSSSTNLTPPQLNVTNGLVRRAMLRARQQIREYHGCSLESSPLGRMPAPLSGREDSAAALDVG